MQRSKMLKLIEDNPLHNSTEGYVFLISWSRLPNFINLCTEIIKDGSKFLHTEIQL